VLKWLHGVLLFTYWLQLLLQLPLHVTQEAGSRRLHRDRHTNMYQSTLQLQFWQLRAAAEESHLIVIPSRQPTTPQQPSYACLAAPDG
jgi:hypothetical protein